MADSIKWYEKAGADSDVVLSTRVRLARNLKDYPFPQRCSLQQRAEIEKKVRSALMSASSLMSSHFEYVPLETLSRDTAISLVERHIISPDFISDIRGKAVLLSKDESISIMINEEDHIRIQVIHEGLCLKETFETADRLDSLLAEHLDFAYSPELGFLTQCPTNLGTALRVSAMLHLPALTELSVMPRMTENLSKLGMIIRGTYGEGSKVTGELYQLSNQVTLGISEQSALDNLEAIVRQLMAEERERRTQLVKNIYLQDKIYRAAGILKSCKVITSNEFMELISYVRMGVSAQLLTGISHAEINKLITGVQPATLAQQANEKQADRDIIRGNIVHKACEELKECYYV